jgi:hypothetical protein
MSQQNRAFEQADADLRAETAAASAGIENLTNSRGSLRLSPPQEKDDGVWYELWLLFRPVGPINSSSPQGLPFEASTTTSRTQGTDSTKKYNLGTFFVSWKGYPIRTGFGRELPDRASIAAYFVDMARDPTSPLVNYLAFNLRLQQPLSA